MLIFYTFCSSNSIIKWPINQLNITGRNECYDEILRQEAVNYKQKPGIDSAVSIQITEMRHASYIVWSGVHVGHTDIRYGFLKWNI
jgi:hypothetical protein